jgi:hypothetical protein
MFWKRIPLLLLACTATAQDLPPDVLLLARLKAHIREDLARIPNTTCLETISRFRSPAGSISKTSLKPLDIVRLEIAYSNRHEWYGSPGDRVIGADRPSALIGVGMIASGAFASTLNNIVEGALFTWRGEETLGEKTAVRFDFTLSRWLKPLTISLQGGRGTVGQKGSLWADPQTLDLIRLESQASEIPPSVPLQQATTTVDYSRIEIGGSNVVLPQHAELHTLDSSGVESYNRLEFTQCRAYSVESELRFDQSESPAALPAIPASQNTVNRSIPSLLKIAVQLTTPVSERDAVGTLIEGTVAGNIMHKGKLLIPDGAVIRGRIRRLNRSQGNGGFIVGLEFTEVEIPGNGPWRFCADLLSIDRKYPRIRTAAFEVVQLPDTAAGATRESLIPVPDLPGVATVIVSGSTFTIPAGFTTTWRTRAALR